MSGDKWREWILQVVIFAALVQGVYVWHDVQVLKDDRDESRSERDAMRAEVVKLTAELRTTSAALRTTKDLIERFNRLPTDLMSDPRPSPNGNTGG